MAYSKWDADIGFGLTAMCTAGAHHRVLPTKISHKFFNVDTAKGIKVSSKVVVKKLERICNEKGIRTHENPS